MLRRRLGLVLGWLAVTVAGFASAGRPASSAGSAAPLDEPLDPPTVRYLIECQIDRAGILKGSETAEFVNQGKQALSRLALAWPGQADPSFELTVNGRAATGPETSTDDAPSPLMLIDLPQVVPPGGKVTLRVRFSKTFRLDQRRRVNLLAWHPRIWWGRETHDDFAVKVQPPAGYALAATGPLDPSSGRYVARGVRSFALILAEGHEVMEARAGDVVVRTIHTKAGAQCSRLLLDTAVEVIQFYRARFGFYPQQSLTIIPGGDRPVGGYPVATGIVVVHGQDRLDAKPTAFWKWITAHEIGHQYWLEHVLSADPRGGWGWLMIGLGIYADREYCRARGITDQHRQFFDEYVAAVRKGIDTTVDLTPEQLDEVTWDFNNIVTHGKGFSIVSALEVTMGRDPFERAYARVLREYAGRPLGVPQFQAVCESEAGRSLDWFFRQWVRSTRYLSYSIAGQSSERLGDEIVTSVEVKRLGSLSMPIPVVASFADGTSQVRFTDRLRASQVVTFRARSAPNEIRLDPAGGLAMVIPPPEPTAGTVSRRISRLSLTGAGEEALALYHEARQTKLARGNDWWRLGLALYDGRHYDESLAAMQEAERLNTGLWQQTAIVWQGHLFDLLGRREDALRCYRRALDQGFTGPMRHDQYNMVVDRKWVEERLTTPFARE